jgi:hypothetical protein
MTLMKSNGGAMRPAPRQARRIQTVMSDQPGA